MSDGFHIDSEPALQEEAIDLSESCPDDWRYLSEGGVTMVFSYTGTAHTVYSSMVLRVRKSVTLSSESISEQAHHEDILSFHRYVIRRLIDPEFLPILLPAYASRDWLSRLAEGAEKWRPEGRREVSRLDVNQHSVVLATNLVEEDGVVVEIKVHALCIYFLGLTHAIRYSQNGDSYQIRNIFLTNHDP